MNSINFRDDADLFGRLYVFTNNQVFNHLRNVDVDLNDAFSWGQLKSKRWLITELEKLNLNLGIVYLCAGWYATLASMLFSSQCNIDKIRSFDIDETCQPVADEINSTMVKDQWRFKAITQNIMDINYAEHSWTTWSKANNRMSYPITEVPNTIINTSCEHIGDFSKWYEKIPNGKLVVLQNNNFLSVEDHVNCVNDPDEFAKQTPMNNVMFEGELILPKYVRFMRIGIK